MIKSISSAPTNSQIRFLKLSSNLKIQSQISLNENKSRKKMISLSSSKIKYKRQSKINSFEQIQRSKEIRNNHGSFWFCNTNNCENVLDCTEKQMVFHSKQKDQQNQKINEFLPKHENLFKSPFIQESQKFIFQDKTPFKQQAFDPLQRPQTPIDKLSENIFNNYAQSRFIPIPIEPSKSFFNLQKKSRYHR